MKKMNKKNYVVPEIEIISLWEKNLMGVKASRVSGSTDQGDIPGIGWGGDNDGEDVPDPTAKGFSWDDDEW